MPSGYNHLAAKDITLQPARQHRRRVRGRSAANRERQPQQVRATDVRLR